MKVAQSCPTHCDPMDYTAHGIPQARILVWIAFPFSRGSSQPRDRTLLSHITGRFFTSWATREAKEYWSGEPIPSPGGLPDTGIRLGSPALQADSLPTGLSGKSHGCHVSSIRMILKDLMLNEISQIQDRYCMNALYAVSKIVKFVETEIKCSLPEAEGRREWEVV